MRIAVNGEYDTGSNPIHTDFFPRQIIVLMHYVLVYDGLPFCVFFFFLSSFLLHKAHIIVVIELADARIFAECAACVNHDDHINRKSFLTSTKQHMVDLAACANTMR